MRLGDPLVARPDEEASPLTRDRDWTQDASVRKLAALQPERFEKFLAFEQAVYEPGALSTKFKELLAVGITHVTQCQACTAAHTRRALEAGATEEEVAEAVFMAMELRAGASIGHFSAAARAMK